MWDMTWLTSMLDLISNQLLCLQCLALIGARSSSACASSMASSLSARSLVHLDGTSSTSLVTVIESVHCATWRCFAWMVLFHGTRWSTSRARSRTAGVLLTSGISVVWGPSSRGSLPETLSMKATSSLNQVGGLMVICAAVLDICFKFKF